MGAVRHALAILVIVSLLAAPFALAAPEEGKGGAGGGGPAKEEGGAGGGPPEEKGPSESPKEAPRDPPNPGPKNPPSEAPEDPQTEAPKDPATEPEGPKEAGAPPPPEERHPGGPSQAAPAADRAAEEQGGGRPDAAGRPDDPGGANGNRPEDAGPPEERGKPDETPGNGKGLDTAAGARDKDNRTDPSERGNGRERDEPRGPREPQGQGSGVFAGGSAIAPASLASSPAPAEAAPPARVRVTAGDTPVSVAKGNVLVRAEGVASERPAFLMLVHPSGRREVLAWNVTETGWNTTGYENGYYEVEVHEQREDGTTYRVASTRVLVENPRASAVAAVAAVATGAVVSVGAGALASRSIDLLSLIKQSVVDVTGDIAEDSVRTRTADVAAIDRRIRVRSLVLMGLACLLLVAFRTYAEADGLGGYLAVLPIAGAAVLLFTLGDYGAEWLLARATGARVRFRLWAPGAISLILSSLLFRSAYGYPGYVSEDDSGANAPAGSGRRIAGLRALAVLGLGVGLSLPFALAGMWWRWDFAEYGIGAALMMGAAAAMPFSPMPGRDVWAWRRLAWVAIFVPLVALYLLWQLALLPLIVLQGVAFVGLLGFAVVLGRLARGGADAL